MPEGKPFHINIGIAQISWSPPLPLPSILGSCGVYLLLNRNIFQNATKLANFKICGLSQLIRPWNFGIPHPGHIAQINTP